MVIVCTGFEIAVTRQESLLKFFKLAGHSDPKQLKINSANQKYGDPVGHSSTSSSIINAIEAPVVSWNYDPHRDREVEDDEMADKHFKSPRDCDGDEAGTVHLCILQCSFVTFHTHAERFYINTGCAPRLLLHLLI